MALPDVCPKCGEKATNDKGQCVFCGTQVIQPATIKTPEQVAKADANYRFASWSFIGVGAIYLVVGVVSSIAYRSPMLGLLISALVSIGHGYLLLAKNEWMQSVTKMVCFGRMVLFLWFLSFLVPLLPLFLVPGILLLALIIYDLACLMLMVNTIDDVYFG